MKKPTWQTLETKKLTLAQFRWRVRMLGCGFKEERENELEILIAGIERLKIELGCL